MSVEVKDTAAELTLRKRRENKIKALCFVIYSCTEALEQYRIKVTTFRYISIYTCMYACVYVFCRV